MPKPTDPTEAMRRAAAEFPAVDAGTSCNQSSFKAGKRAFLFVGPGAKGVGFKAMFKLGPSLSRAAALAADEPGRYEVGTTGWVTARFSAEAPLPKALWAAWLAESYAMATGDAGVTPRAKSASGSTPSTPASKSRARKTSARRRTD